MDRQRQTDRHIRKMAQGHLKIRHISCSITLLFSPIVTISVNPTLRRNRFADRGDLTVPQQRTPVMAIEALRLQPRCCGTVFLLNYVVVHQ